MENRVETAVQETPENKMRRYVEFYVKATVKTPQSYLVTYILGLVLTLGGIYFAANGGGAYFLGFSVLGLVMAGAMYKITRKKRAEAVTQIMADYDLTGTLPDDIDLK